LVLSLPRHLKYDLGGGRPEVADVIVMVEVVMVGFDGLANVVV
jgi:hypothetical protein